jgi:hypothetical protein
MQDLIVQQDAAYSSHTVDRILGRILHLPRVPSPDWRFLG